MRILDAERTAALLPYHELAEAVVSVLKAYEEGRIFAPPRTQHRLPGGGALLFMVAWADDIGIVKRVGVHPGQAETVQAELTVFDAESGAPRLLLEGKTLTARRTAALTLAAAKQLAPAPEGPLLLVGAGRQARAHLEALAGELGTRKVWIASRGRERAEKLLARARELGLEGAIVDRPERVLPEARLIVTATTSEVPLFEDRVAPDAFVAAIGAFTPEAAELPPELVRRAYVVVDTLEGAREEAGDLIQAGIDWESVVPLENALTGQVPKGPIVFKSVGHAIFDLAAARVALQHLDAEA